MVEEKLDGVKKWARETIAKWHEVNPDYVFLTESASIPPGYILKEAWIEAYGKKDMPKFYRLDPQISPSRGAHMHASYKLSSSERERYLKSITEKAIEGEEKYFKSRIKKRNPKIIVYDDGGGPFFRFGLLYKNGEKESSEANFGDSLSCGLGTINNWIKKQNAGGEIYGASGVPLSMPTGYEHGGSARPTSRLFGVGLTSNHRAKTPDEEMISLTYLRKLLGEGNFTYAGRIVKHPEQRKRALAYVRELKELGREAGEELHTELEKKKKLEQIVSGVVGIFGLASSFFLLGSSVTGNAIGNLGKSSGSWLGIILLVIGLIAGFFWLKNRK
jgi:hypothetical protein